MINNRNRCNWVSDDPLYIEYHDNEWGIPVKDDSKLFEYLMLESFQAGLSWITILKKRDNFRTCFDNFDYKKIALYDDVKIEELMSNKGIIRHRLKIISAINNAKKYVEIQKEFGSFSNFIWSFTNHRTIKGNWNHSSETPKHSQLSDNISRELKNRGFKFLGSITIYAFLQAIGVINNHEKDCICYTQNQIL